MDVPGAAQLARPFLYVSNFGIRPSACWLVLPFVASASREASVESPCLSDFSSSLVGGRVTFDAANAGECKRTNLQKGSIVLGGKDPGSSR